MKFLIIDREPLAVFADDKVAGASAEKVTHRQATRASDRCDNQCWKESQHFLECEIAGENEEPLIWNRESNDSKNQ
jgi:hypothetical protein